MYINSTYFPFKAFHHAENFPGMDMTVTAPLDMGTGQQRFVVAYTLKQNVEKQPDILNAQKSMKCGKSSLRSCRILFSVKIFLSVDTENLHTNSGDGKILDTSPALRPDALYLTKSNYAPNYVNIFFF